MNSLKNLFKKLMDAQVENYRKVADEIVCVLIGLDLLNFMLRIQANM